MSQQPAKKDRVIYDNPSNPPQQSLHWKHLVSDGAIAIPLNEAAASTDDGLIHSHDELIAKFQTDVASLTSNDDKENYKALVALWSIIIGYCEALCTHKDETRRFCIFPIPIAALRKLLDEFIELLNGVSSKGNLPSTDNNSSISKKSKARKESTTLSLHRRTVQTLSNSLWKRAQNKTNMKDELHANNLYILLRGNVDNKSLDCFGAALLTVTGMNILGFESCLTLSEDHAYESHWEEESVDDGTDKASSSNSSNGSSKTTPLRKRATCEVAIPGNTLASQSKRGKEISETFIQLKSSITPESSWLYMASNPVLCDSPGMALAALLSNVNCDVEKMKMGTNSDGKPQVVSKALYKLKRDMLWTLFDAGYMKNFPFALMELGECEEHVGSERGMEWVNVGSLVKNMDADVDTTNVDTSAKTDETTVLWNEKLFLDAISVSRNVYNDSQVYPYLYAGHYHKDAGRQSTSNEYRLVEALRLYAEASRVASQYKYETKDCMQLMKHMTTVASLIQRDILQIPTDCNDKSKNVTPRIWTCHSNAVAAATWILGFFDSLLFWEEKEEASHVEIFGISHKYGVTKLWQLLPFDVRVEATSKIHTNCSTPTKFAVITENEMLYFKQPRSSRLATESLLTAALSKEKVIVKDLDMALPTIENTRQRKRARTDD